MSSLLVTLPIETARRRLQIQSRSPTPTSSADSAGAAGQVPFKACVETSPRPYAGVIACIFRIATEESAARGGEGTGWLAGVKQLYRGFGLNLAAASLSALVLKGVIWGIGAERGGGWREI